MALLVFATPSAPAANCDPPPSGIVSWWPGEGNALDIQGTNNGIFTNAAFGPGEVGQAFSFDGSGNNVRIPASPSMDVGAGAGMTVEAWVDSTDNTYAAPIVEWISPLVGGYAVHLYAHQGGPGALYADLYDTAGNHHTIQSATGLLQTNVFQHVALTYEKSSGIGRLFLNGTQVMQANVGTFAPQTSPDLSIGYRPSTVPFGPIAFKGRIDEVTLFSRALSATELQAIYSAGTAGKCFSAPPNIFLQPANQTVMLGHPATFSVIASGSQPLTFQWTMDGTNMPGATSDILVLTNVQPADAGAYAVQVTNSLGSILSSNAVLTVTSPTCAPPSSGLVSWWPGEGNARDIVETNNGGLFNGASYTNGQVGECFSFNGASNGYAEIPDSPSLSFTNDFTVELWYKDMGIPGGALAGLVAKRPYSGPCNYGLSISGGNQGEFLVYFSDPQYGSYQGSTFAPLPPPGSWHHLAATFRQVSAEQLEIDSYVDGQLVKTATFSGNLSRTVNDYPLHLGCSNPPGGEFFTGDLDEVSIYNRALTAGEIAAVFNAGSLGKCVTPTPPRIFSQPISQNTFVGSTVSFGVGAAGSQPLTYQWTLDATNLLGATNAFLTLTNVQVSQSGTYAVAITNALGYIISSNADLVVTPPPPCALPPSNLVAWWPAEGNADDFVGADNGTTLPGITFVPGMVGQAFAFDGTSGAITIPGSPTLNVQSLTIEAWIFPTDLTAPRPILEFADPTGPCSLNIWYNLGSGAQANPGALFGFARDATNFNNNFYVASSGGLVPANQWSHVALTYDAVAGKAVLYLNGAIVATNTTTAPVHPNTHLGVNLGYRPLGSSDLFAGRRHAGKLDEVSLYSRALSAKEILAIYDASISGKCSGPITPTIVGQPLTQTVVAGSSASFSVGAAGSEPLSYQWNLNNVAIPDATNASLVLNNVQRSQAGSYSVVVTNLYGSASSSNATLAVNFPPASIYLGNTSGAAGQMITVPITLVANGNENAVGFSVSYSPALLTNAGVTLGSGASGASLVVNPSQAGAVGIGVALSSGATFAPGTQEVARISFVTAVSATGFTAPLSFGDQPVQRLLVDANAKTLPVSFKGGQVILTKSSFEADVAPRSDGDGKVDISDWVQIGRFVAALDTPSSSEFQRADCAPRDTQGDGVLTVSDWVQAGRYAAGLDPANVAGGPTVPAGGQVIVPRSHKQGTDPLRTITIQGPLIFQGQTGTAFVQLEAQGDENAVGFSLGFDPTVVTYAGYVAGADDLAAAIDVNSNQATNGQLGIIVGWSAGLSFTPGTRQLIKVNFQAVTSNSVNSAVSLTDQPVRREISDTNALPVVATYSNGIIEVNPRPSLTITHSNQNATLAWPLWATNYTLQQALGTTWPINSWTNLSIVPVVTTNAETFTLPLSGSAQFFRLQHQ